MRRTRPARRALLRTLGIAGLAVLASGCADMKDQARFEPLEKTNFFADGRASRPLVEGTVPRGFLREDDRFYRGLDPDGTFVARMPVPVDAALLERGRNRYEIFCAPCHSLVGDGLGMIVQRGYKQPTSYHDPRLRAVADGYIYDVITNGFGQMLPYASQVQPADRWAIVAYIRALQLAQYADLTSVDAQARAALERNETYDPRPAPEASGHGHGAKKHQEAGHGSAH